MNGYADIKSIPLARLPVRTRNLLSCLLDATKIIPCDGPDKLPRDWRGLASRLNISAEYAANIQQFSDKTGRVLEKWLQDPRATVGHLLEHLEYLDRYDVYDDVCADLQDIISNSEPLPNPQNQLFFNGNAESPPASEQTRLITYDDRPGYEHHYHAFVLHAKEDQEFVDEMLRRLRGDGFQICTVEQLQAGHMSQYAPVSKLISERCERIILVYSPDFLNSPSNKFYSTYAQAVSVETQLKILPIMYRECQLPVHLTYYHKLYYSPADGRTTMYDFWQKLKQSLAQSRVPVPTRHNGTLPLVPRNVPVTSEPSSEIGIRITEVPYNNTEDCYYKDRLFLSRQHASMSDLASLTVSMKSEDTKSVTSDLSNRSDIIKKEKKPKCVWKLINTLKGKSKKGIMVAN